MSGKSRDVAADMELTSGPDKAEREDAGGITDIGQMSLDLDPSALAAQITRASARTKVGDVNQGTRDKLTQDAAGAYSWDGKPLAKMSEADLHALRETLVRGGLKFDER